LIDEKHYEQPVMIIADINLPGRKGIDLLADLRNSNWKIPFILFAQENEKELAFEARKMGNVLVFESQFDIDDFRTAVFCLLGQDKSLPNVSQGHQTPSGLKPNDIQFGKQGGNGSSEAEERFRILEENAFEGVLIHDSGRIRLVNPALASMLGYKLSDLIGMQVSDISAQESHKSILNKIQTGFDRPYHAFGLRKNGSKLLLEIIGKPCVYKGQFAQMAAIRDISEKQQVLSLSMAYKNLEQVSITDELTGLYNSRHLKAILNSEIERSRRSGQPLSLLMIDVDHFKLVNDRHGHQMGDAVLHKLGQILLADRRQNDVVARYGGDEFAILLVDTPCAIAVDVADRLRAKIEAEWFQKAKSGLGIASTISIGVASFPIEATTPQDLIAASDKALYEAKLNGRNRVKLFKKTGNFQ